MKKTTSDLHFSGYTVCQELIKELLTYGFVRDNFTNNTRCCTTEFHATYKKGLDINNQIYNKVCSIIRKYPNTVADLEWEFSRPNLRIEYDNRTNTVETSRLEIWEPFKLKEVPTGQTKSADIHLACDWNLSNDYSKNILERFEMISFDRPFEDREGFKRVFTLTFSTAREGHEWFGKFHNLLTNLDGFVGKLKLEFLKKQFRFPDNAPVLPLVYFS
jgi:hypothetical protein